MTKARLKAFVLHLIFSCALVGCFLYFFVQYWYPEGVLWLQGGLDILLLMVLVDLVLGPLITLIVFRPEVKSSLHLSLDMLCVVMIQLCAFSYAVWILGAQRPIWLAYVYDRFYLVSADDAIGGAKPSVQDLLSPKRSIAVAHVQLPWLIELSGSGLEPGPEGGVPVLGAVPDTYVPFPRDMNVVKQRAVQHDQRTAVLERARAKGCGEDNDAVVIPVVGRKSSGYAVLDKNGSMLCVLR